MLAPAGSSSRGLWSEAWPCEQAFAGPTLPSLQGLDLVVNACELHLVVEAVPRIELAIVRQHLVRIDQCGGPTAVVLRVRLPAP